MKQFGETAQLLVSEDARLGHKFFDARGLKLQTTTERATGGKVPRVNSAGPTSLHGRW